MREIPDLLPGRAETIELWPLSQGEIDQTSDGFVDSVFEHGPDIDAPEPGLRREDYLERALRGGYPEAVRRIDLGRRARFFEPYVSDVINRGVRQVSEIERPADLRRLLNLLAASTASLAIPAAFANRLQLPASTVKRYLDHVSSLGSDTIDLATVTAPSAEHLRIGSCSLAAPNRIAIVSAVRRAWRHDEARASRRHVSRSGVRPARGRRVAW